MSRTGKSVDTKRGFLGLDGMGELKLTAWGQQWGVVSEEAGSCPDLPQTKPSPRGLWEASYLNKGFLSICTCRANLMQALP